MEIKKIYQKRKFIIFIAFCMYWERCIFLCIPLIDANYLLITVTCCCSTVLVDLSSGFFGVDGLCSGFPYQRENDDWTIAQILTKQENGPELENHIFFL